MEIEYKGHKLKKYFVKNLEYKERLEVSNFLFNYFRQHGFPFPKFSSDELQKDWLNLLNFNSKNIENNNIILDYKRVGSKIFKHYSPHIFEAKTKNKPSMLEAFEDDNLLKACINNRLGITYKETFNITPAMLRQGFRNAYISSQISIFKPVIAKFIYDKFTSNNDIVYDFSIGFGQRFLGAMSTNKNLFYIGCDPWEKSINSVNEISKFINIKNFYIKKIGSEYFKPRLFKNKVSLAFSSPPYFNKEIYDNNNNTQAYYNGYNEYAKWLKHTIQNIIYMLKNNGKLIINIPEEIFNTNKDLFKDFNLINTYFIQLSRNAKFSINKREPIYVFEKKHKLKRLSTNTTNEIIERYLSGESSENIAKSLDINGTTVCRKLKKNNIKIRPASENKRKYSFDQNWLDIVNTQEKAYFLGLMITDGTVHSKRAEASIGLFEPDKNILEQISNILYSKNLIHLYSVKGSKYNVAKLNFYGKVFKDNLIKHNCVSKKTFITRYPKSVPEHLHSHFIRGLYDGDGCIYIGSKRTCVDFVGTIELCKSIENIINNIYQMNINFSYYNGEKHRNNICSMRINRQKDVVQFLNFIYQNANLYIDRKYQKYLKIIK